MNHPICHTTQRDVFHKNYKLSNINLMVPPSYFISTKKKPNESLCVFGNIWSYRKIYPARNVASTSKPSQSSSTESGIRIIDGRKLKVVKMCYAPVAWYSYKFNEKWVQVQKLLGRRSTQARRYGPNPSFPEKEKTSRAFENVFQ